MNSNLGTLLRHLTELLDGAVTAAYEEAGLVYRPRYTSVMRALMALEPSTIGQIAEAAGITQPAATQTIALMIKEGIITAEAGPADARQKMIRLTEHGHALVPKLEACWAATTLASVRLEQELPFELTPVLQAAIRALDSKPFNERIREARTDLSKKKKKP